MIKHQVDCSECNHTFFLEDAQWCEHRERLGVGTQKCPWCGECICHGNTIEEIRARFKKNRESGKFVKAKPNSFGYEYMCKSVREVEVNE